MQFESLKVFCDVARNQSFSRAADANRISQSAVSQIVNQLEKPYGRIAVENPKAAAQQVYSFVLGTVLQAKIQNDVRVLRNLEPTVMAIIGASTAVPA